VGRTATIYPTGQNSLEQAGADFFNDSVPTTDAQVAQTLRTSIFSILHIAVLTASNLTLVWYYKWDCSGSIYNGTSFYKVGG